jgi:hypothetical protein
LLAVLGFAAALDVAGLAADFVLAAVFFGAVLGFAVGFAAEEPDLADDALAGDERFLPDITFSATCVRTRLPATSAAASANFLKIFLIVPMLTPIGKLPV